MQNATDAMRESRVAEILHTVSTENNYMKNESIFWFLMIICLADGISSV